MAKKGSHITDEHKRRISKANEGKVGHWKGKHLTEEHRRNISLGHMDHVPTLESRKRMSKAVKKWWSRPGIKGRMSQAQRGKHKHSEETRRKISEGNKGKIISEEQRHKISQANRGKKHHHHHRKKKKKDNKNNEMS